MLNIEVFLSSISFLAIISGSIPEFIAGIMDIGGGIYLVTQIIILGTEKEAAACGAIHFCRKKSFKKSALDFQEEDKTCFSFSNSRPYSAKDIEKILTRAFSSGSMNCENIPQFQSYIGGSGQQEKDIMGLFTAFVLCPFMLLFDSIHRYLYGESAVSLAIPLADCLSVFMSTSKFLSKFSSYC